MANVFSNALGGAIGQHAAALAGSAGQTVTYRRGGAAGDTVSLAATKCPVKSELDPTFGVLRVSECDWIIKAASLVLDSATVTPQRMDQVVESDGTVWDVMPLDGMEQEYRPLDPFSTAWRIHSKRTKAPD